MTAVRDDEMADCRIDGVRTEYGTAVIPNGAQWTGGWSSAGLPIKYADGREGVVRFTPDPPPSHREIYGVWTEVL